MNDQIVNNTEENIFFDRCVIDNYIYSSLAHKKGAISDEFLKETQDIMYNSLNFIDALLFVPTSVSIKLVDDKLRDTDTLFIDEVNRFFIKTLFEITRVKNIHVWVISGTREDRIKQVSDFLER